jgi:hypothetical protein
MVSAVRTKIKADENQWLEKSWRGSAEIIGEINLLPILLKDRQQFL